MKPGTLVPRGSLDKKPKHGEPCNHCGLCCVATLCSVGQYTFKRERGPCPALRTRDGLSTCGLVEDPASYAPGLTLMHGASRMSAAAVVAIGAGLGCDARFNGEKPDQKFYTRLRHWDREHYAERRNAKNLWGVP